MINLLPPDIRENNKYAYKNTKMRSYTFGMVLILAAVVVVFVGGAIYLRQNTTAIANQVSSTQTQLELEDQSKIKAEIAELSDTFTLVVEVLSNQVLFSKMITQVGSVMPNGSVLSTLSINELSGDLDLQIKATDYDTATQAQVNLQDPNNRLFKSADIINIQCTSSDDPNSTEIYPCNMQIKALFADTNQFLLINNGENDDD